MSAINIEVPDAQLRKLEKLAAHESLSLTELAQQVLARVAKDWEDYEYWEERAKKGNLEDLRRVLAKAPDVPPIPGDELPAGWTDETNKH